MVQISHLCTTTGKTIALTMQTFVSKVMSLLFNTPSAAAAAAKLLQLCLTLCDPMDYSLPGSRQEYWSGLPFPSPGDHPNPEISPGCSLGGLILKLKLQYFGLLMQRADLLEKTLMTGKD